MSSFWIAVVALGSMVAGLMTGLLCRLLVPESHTTGDSKDTVKLGLGLLATMSALVLGLLVATTKGTYDSQVASVKDLASSVALLDRTLARYGPETAGLRQTLKQGTELLIEQMWPSAGGPPAQVSSVEVRLVGEAFFDRLSELNPRTDAQKLLRSRAMEMMINLGNIRQKLIVQQQSAIPTPFLVVLIAWLSMLFGCYGMLSPRNATVIAIQVVCMASVASSLFLVLEMDRPFGGIIRVPSSPMVETLRHLGE